MSKSSHLTLNLSDTIKFNQDEMLPAGICQQTFKVTDTSTLLVNDFYFNEALFCCWELTGTTGDKIYLSPFTFEEDETPKLRVTKLIEPVYFQSLFQEQSGNNIFASILKDSAFDRYISIHEQHVPEALKNWISRTYYLDMKEQEKGSCCYVQYDCGHKKNLNQALLLKKYPFQKYFLFSGDYNSFYLEVNAQDPTQIFATVFLNESDISEVISKDAPILQATTS